MDVYYTHPTCWDSPKPFYMNEIHISSRLWREKQYILFCVLLHKDVLKGTTFF